MKLRILKFRIKNYYFSPRLLPNLAFISLFPLLISLGVWQIHRGDEKHNLQIQFIERQQTKPVVLNKLKMIHVDQAYLPILAEGHFDNKQSVLLDNKIYQHQIGYEVLTPFILKNSHHVILVNRGWIPQGRDRKTLPAIKSIAKNITIEGLLFWPQKTFSFKNITEKKWPQRLQTLTPQFLKKNDLPPFIVIINKPGPYSFIPLWRPVILQASRHYAYAFQWFALSLTLLIASFISQLSAYDVK